MMFFHTIPYFVFFFSTFDTHNGNQFNDRVIQSFAFCHNLIKNRNTTRTENERSARFIRKYDYGLFTSLVFGNKLMYIVAPD